MNGSRVGGSAVVPLRYFQARYELSAAIVVWRATQSFWNPGPFATGFNDRMANDPGDWFDRNSADPEDVAIMDSLVKRITVGQLDPADVVKRYVDLVEADATELVNFIPEDMLERLSKPKPA